LVPSTTTPVLESSHDCGYLMSFMLPFFLYWDSFVTANKTTTVQEQNRIE
jgi:hypothetical protein